MSRADMNPSAVSSDAWPRIRDNHSPRSALMTDRASCSATDKRRLSSSSRPSSFRSSAMSALYKLSRHLGTCTCKCASYSKHVQERLGPARQGGRVLIGAWLLG